MNVKKLIALIALLLVSAFGVLLFHAPPKAFAQSSAIPFTLSTPGVALDEPNTLLVAAQLINTSNKAAFEVTIDSIQLASAPLLTQTPISIGKVDADRGAVVQANFNSSRLTQGERYRLIMRGSYRTGREDRSENQEKRRKFIVQSAIVLPSTKPGSTSVRTTTVPANKVTGAPYRPQRPRFDQEVNRPRWTVPTGKFKPGTPSPSGTSIQKLPSNDLSQLKTSSSESPQKKVMIAQSPTVTFKLNSKLRVNSSTTAEPSGGSSGGVIFASANWLAAYSTDGGGTFTQLDPTTIFPNDAIGFCCDQIIQYVPSIDRFIWLLQGSNGYRLASASPSDIINSNGTAWTYWNLPSTLFGQPNGTGLDYPDLSVGNNALYASWDVGTPCPTNCRGGFQVSRIALAGIRAGGTITIDYTDPANAPMAWGSHLTQNTLDEIFWAGHNSNNQMRVFSLKEGSNTYFWRDVGLSSWANNAPTSTTPDGQDWLAKNFNGPGGNSFPRNGIIGGTRSGNQIWFAWSAGTDQNFKQPHIEMVALDRNNNFTKTQQVKIWNNEYAFAYPALATNACTNEVGLSFEFGGNGNYENHVVGFWGDFVAYITTASNVGTTRFGDYVTIRQAPRTKSDPGNLFTAFGYGLNKVPPPGTGTTTDIRYVLFGRPASSCQIIK